MIYTILTVIIWITSIFSIGVMTGLKSDNWWYPMYVVAISYVVSLLLRILLIYSQ